MLSKNLANFTTITQVDAETAVQKIFGKICSISEFSSTKSCDIHEWHKMPGGDLLDKYT